MISANFGPSSGNPRERRAYTHALIDKARASTTSEDFVAAVEQVTKVEAGEMPRKTKNARFNEALVGVALADFLVNRVATVGNDLLENGERRIVTWVGTEENPKDLVSASLASPSFNLARGKGAIMMFGAVRDRATGYEEPYQLSVTSHSGSISSGDRRPHSIPYKTDSKTGVRRVDAVRLKQTKPEELAYLAKQAARIPTSEEYRAADAAGTALPQEGIDDIMNKSSLH